MAEIGRKNMLVRKLGHGLAFALVIAAGSAGAQQLTDRQLINTLGQAAATAAAIDPALLAQEVEANLGKGLAGQPAWTQLAQLAQLAVEIDFENDSVAIEPASYRTIGLIADALHHPILLPYKFMIVGHSSSTGDAKHNLKLSQDRAVAIMEALSTTFAVAPNRLFAIGVGQEQPIDPANPKAAANRRVQLINIGRAK